MTDLELLELAAKAAGLYERIGFQNSTNEPLLYDRNLIEVFQYGSNVPAVRWNPLKENGDAFALAVRLKMTVRHEAGEVAASVAIGPVYTKEPTPYVKASEVAGGDPAAATRRAIVRAAAAIVQDA
jgi:hypothetical protein